VTVLPTPSAARSGWGRAWGVASDLLIAIVVLWTLPLLLGLVGALVRLIQK
jgi:hypothetical protein